MLKIFVIIGFVVLIVIMSGCLDSDNPSFMIIGDNEIMTNSFATYTIMGSGSENGKVSYNVCWNDGTCKDIKGVSVNATVPLRHTWFVSGNYTIKVTATYDDNSTATVVKRISVRD